MKKITIDGVAYAPIQQMPGENWCIIRSKDAGCFLAILDSKEYTPAGLVVQLRNSRRLWYWSGASSLSQLALEGVKNPQDCKFPIALPHQEVIGVCEIIPATQEAVNIINNVPVWEQ